MLILFIGIATFMALTLDAEKEKEPLPPFKVVFQSLHYEHSWDISNNTSLWSFFVFNNIAETLVRVKNNSNFEAGLASGWVFSDDKKTIKFSISDKYKFHDGRPITPEDVLLSLRRSFSSGLKFSELGQSFASSNLEESLILEGNTIKMRLKEPLNAAIYKLSIPEMGVAPQDYAQGKTHKESLNNLSGPYKVVDFTPKKLSLEKHPGHPLLDEKSPEKVDILQIPEVEKGIEYYQKNDNVLLVGSGYEKVLKYVDLKGEKYVSAPALTEFFVPNTESRHLNTKAKRRKVFSAIKMAFEKIQIDGRIAERTDQIFTEDSLSRLKESQLKNLYDKAISKQSLKLSVILLESLQENPIPFLLRDQLKPHGIELEIVTGDNKGLRERIKKGNYDFIYFYSGVSPLDTIVGMIYLFGHPLLKITPSKATTNALEKAKTEVDRDKYAALLGGIHWNMLNEYQILPLMHTKMIYCAKGLYQLRDLSYFDGGLNLWDWHKAK